MIRLKHTMLSFLRSKVCLHSHHSISTLQHTVLTSTPLIDPKTRFNARFPPNITVNEYLTHLVTNGLETTPGTLNVAVYYLEQILSKIE